MHPSRNHITPESDLIKGCIAGQRDTQEELYHRFAPVMYAVCLRYANNTSDAQDLLQDGFIKVYKNLYRFRAEGSFEGWIRRIVINTCIEYYRRSKVNFLSVSEKEAHLTEPSDLTALDKLAEKDIINIIQELAPGYKAVFNMYMIEGYTHKEIGDLLGISEGTSKSQLARAKSILKNKVEQFLQDTSYKPPADTK